MNNKRRRHKAARAGFLLCKRHKVGGAKHVWLAHRGFAKLGHTAALPSSGARRLRSTICAPCRWR